MQSTWAMERLARALENADKSIRVDVSDFYGKLDPESYFDWIASLETFFDCKDMSEDRTVKLICSQKAPRSLPNLVAIVSTTSTTEGTASCQYLG